MSDQRQSVVPSGPSSGPSAPWPRMAVMRCGRGVTSGKPVPSQNRISVAVLPQRMAPASQLAPNRRARREKKEATSRSSPLSSASTSPASPTTRYEFFASADPRSARERREEARGYAERDSLMDRVDRWPGERTPRTAAEPPGGRTSDRDRPPVPWPLGFRRVRRSARRRRADPRATTTVTTRGYGTCHASCVCGFECVHVSARAVMRPNAPVST